jgi:acyl-coenzyme A synthetase/AMP-(fatty) acid ligase
MTNLKKKTTLFQVCTLLFSKIDGSSRKSFSYKSAFDQSRRFGSALAKEGFAKGDVLAIHLPNCPQYITSVLGTMGILANIFERNLTAKCTFFSLSL